MTLTNLLCAGLNRAIWILTLLVCLGLTGRANAQSNAADSAVNGYVTDNTKLPVNGATVALVNERTSASVNQMSGSDGYFRFALVPVGASASGWRWRRRSEYLARRRLDPNGFSRHDVSAAKEFK
jgi:hypothetical protein